MRTTLTPRVKNPGALADGAASLSLPLAALASFALNYDYDDEIKTRET
jgi:hypothetical protein